MEFVFEEDVILTGLVNDICAEQIQWWSPECTFPPFLANASTMLCKGSLRSHLVSVLFKGKIHCCAKKAHAPKPELNDI